MIKEEIKRKGYSDDLMLRMGRFVKDIGLNNSEEYAKPSKKENAIKQLLNIVVLHNPYFHPRNDVDLTMRAFMKEAIYGGVEIKYRNNQGIVEAFNKWVSRPHIQSAFKVVKELPPKTERLIEEWTDDEISRAVENARKLGLDWQSSFLQRINKQAKERGLI